MNIHDATAQVKLSSQEVQGIAADTYIYGYPLVVMDVSRQVMTAVSKPENGKAPINQFGMKTKFPDASFTDVVSPNADTLYSPAWLDLSKEPMVLSVPNTHDRYYLMPMLSGWTDVFASPGKRTTGTEKGDFAIVGPRWQGTLPAGLKEIKSPTEMVWILGRTQTNGKSDYAAVNKIQKEYRLTPLSAWGKNYTPPVVSLDPKTDLSSPVDQVAKMDAATFYARLAELMKGNPPAAADAPMVAKMAKIGIVPGESFKPTVSEKDLETGYKTAQAKLMAAAKESHGKPVNGWDVIRSSIGTYGTNYPLRAFIALFGLGANLPQDAIYPSARVDTEGQPLNGANRYVVHFNKGETPPVNAFWSLTMYNDKQFFVANPINRYAIGDRDQLKFNSDGSLDIYIQNKSPGADKELNWLPAPEGSFNVIMRMYWPKEQVLNGTWNPPGIQKVK